MSFRDYESDYNSQLDSVKKDLKSLEHSLEESARKSGKIFNRHDLVRRVIEQHSHMKGSLAHMELESNEVPAAQRAGCKERLANMKKEAFALEKEVQQMKARAEEADRSDLLRRAGSSATAGSPAGGNNNNNNKGDEQLAEVAKNTQTMQKGSTTLRRALQYVVRMNESGEATLVELKKQDETIDRISGQTDATDAEATVGQRILREMKMTMMKNQIMLSAVVIVLVVMIVGILYYRFGRPIAAAFDSASGNVNDPSTSTSTSFQPGTVIGAPVVAPHDDGSTPPSSSSSSSSSFVSALDGFAPAPSVVNIQPLIP